MEASSVSLPRTSRLMRIKRSMSPSEWRRAGGMAAVIAGLHVVGFSMLILVVAPYHAPLLKRTPKGEPGSRVPGAWMNTGLSSHTGSMTWLS